MIERYTDLHKDSVLAMLKDNSGKASVFKQQKRLFELFPDTGVLIMDSFNNIVGCAHYRKEKKPGKNKEIDDFAFPDKNCLHYYLNMIYVVPEARKQGYAQEFMAWLEYQAGTKAIPKIVFGSESGNEAANSLFSKLGYEKKEVKALNGSYYNFWKKDVKPRLLGAGFAEEWRSKPKHI
jgi:ribosomal protein S18 acetylase RimI-like enzyme